VCVSFIFMEAKFRCSYYQCAVGSRHYSVLFCGKDTILYLIIIVVVSHLLTTYARNRPLAPIQCQGYEYAEYCNQSAVTPFLRPVVFLNVVWPIRTYNTVYWSLLTASAIYGVVTQQVKVTVLAYLIYATCRRNVTGMSPRHDHQFMPITSLLA
jgi:hypothetical protein